MSAPKFVRRFRERAILPSRKSERAAKLKNTSASVSFTGERENMAHRNAAVRKKRETVILFGRFMQAWQ